MDVIGTFIQNVGYLFYIVDPKEHTFETVPEVPDYYKEATAVFIVAIVLEQLILFLSGKPTFRVNDSVTSICQGMLVELSKIPLRGAELLVYTWIYNNYCMCRLPWNSTATWIFCLIGTDFCFYWMHRATHQISVLWMIHEVHHSSEEFNLIAPLRLNVLQSATFWLAYLPLALAVPPSIFLVHYQLNIVYQYWLHTEVVPKLGAIEWIFVTPTHHRIHHGRNRRCIDKNFGGFLIIWDRIFGTFEADKRGENIAYGLVHPLQTFSPIAIQTNHLRNVVKRLVTLKGVKNKLFVLLKGPGWSPGAPWLGHKEDIPESPAIDEKYDPHIPIWMRSYVAIHLLTVLLIYLHVIFYFTKISVHVAMCCGFFIVFSTISFGILLDGRYSFPFIEVCRCLLYFLMDSVFKQDFLHFYICPVLCTSMLRIVFSTSFVLFMIYIPISAFCMN